MFTIAHRRLLDASRTRRRRPTAPLPPQRLVPVSDALRESEQDIEAVAARLADRELLDGLLAHLTDEQREVLLLRFAADLDTATVGEVTGRSANAVAAITRRALATLREVLDQA